MQRSKRQPNNQPTEKQPKKQADSGLWFSHTNNLSQTQAMPRLSGWLALSAQRVVLGKSCAMLAKQLRMVTQNKRNMQNKETNKQNIYKSW